MLIGRRYVVPQRARQSLERVFGEPVHGVLVIECSRYARAHRRMYATTRPNRILLAGPGDDFVDQPEIMLHEYFHVLRQWQPGALTRFRYLAESARHGYRDNRFEREAREFASAQLALYLAHYRGAPGEGA
jgi:hypothetical protein